MAATGLALFGKGGGPDVELNLKAQCPTEPMVAVLLGATACLKASGKSTQTEKLVVDLCACYFHHGTAR